VTLTRGFEAREGRETMIEIEYGNREGCYFIQGHFDTLTRLAGEILACVPGATDWRIWYDPDQDYHRLSFRLKDDVYMVRYYKVFALVKNGTGEHLDIGPSRNFGRHYDSLVKHIRDED
jgi:hypothetical protein